MDFGKAFQLLYCQAVMQRADWGDRFIYIDWVEVEGGGWSQLIMAWKPGVDPFPWPVTLNHIMANDWQTVPTQTVLELTGNAGLCRKLPPLELR